ncbi:MAG: C39 family peptidase, partial [Lentisphaeraceae bacterium]|nr:C39 family peptidase [Lentisphaeraceae bacterium]
MKKNPVGSRTVVPYKAVFQKHDTCFPTSVAAVLGAFDDDVDEDELAREISYGGTPGWRVFEWLEKRGYALKHFLPNKENVTAVINLNIPFLMLTSTDSSGHASAGVGFDEASQTLIVHDPSAERWQHFLIEKIDKYESPLGPHCIAVIPHDRAGELSFLDDSTNELLLAYENFFQIASTQGISKTGELVDSIKKKFGEHDICRYLEAIFTSNRGEHSQSIEILEQLAQKHPNSANIRKSLIVSCRRTGNTGMIRNVLEDIVKRKKVPGISAEQSWVTPPVTYICQYADYISQTADNFSEAQKLLRQCIYEAPSFAEAYHVYADLLSIHEKRRESLLPYMLASYLEEENDHYARAAADSLQNNVSHSAGIEFMEKRYLRLSSMDCGAPAALSFIDLLEDYGCPARAIEEMDKALERYKKSWPLVSFASRFWIRLGNWHKARVCVDALEKSDNKISYYGAAVYYFEMSGQWQEAVRIAKLWFDEAPGDENARRYHLKLVGISQGLSERLALVKSWYEAKPHNEAFQDLYLSELSNGDDHETRIELLNKRLEKNKDDAWAWRELGRTVAEKYDCLSVDDRQSLGL